MEKRNITVTVSDEYESFSVTIESTSPLSLSGAAQRAAGIIIDLVNGSNLS